VPIGTPSCAACRGRAWRQAAPPTAAPSASGSATGWRCPTSEGERTPRRQATVWSVRAVRTSSAMGCSSRHRSMRSGAIAAQAASAVRTCPSRVLRDGGPIATIRPFWSAPATRSAHIPSQWSPSQPKLLPRQTERLALWRRCVCGTSGTAPMPPSGQPHDPIHSPNGWRGGCWAEARDPPRGPSRARARAAPESVACAMLMRMPRGDLSLGEAGKAIGVSVDVRISKSDQVS
jgi:hypothetical protein